MLGLLVTIVVVLVVAGLLLYFLGFLPLDPTMHQLIRAVVICGAVLYILYALWVTFGHRLPLVH